MNKLNIKMGKFCFSKEEKLVELVGAYPIKILLLRFLFFGHSRSFYNQLYVTKKLTSEKRKNLRRRKKSFIGSIGFSGLEKIL